jgi:EmrB/QacA subfamily drug resistance transporter
MTTLDTGIIDVLNPVWVREFSVPMGTAYWLELAFAIPLVGMLLPAGYLADRLGRRGVFLSGMLMFSAGSALMTMLPDFRLLLGARAIQGIGAACIQANSGVLTVQAFPWNQRGRALGIIGSVVAVGLMSGPVVGGALTDAFGWRSSFLVNLAIAAIFVPLGWRVLRPSAINKERRFDFVGALFFVAAVGLLLVALNQGNEWGWASRTTLVFFGGFAISVAAFVWASLRAEQPAIDLRLYRNRDFSVAVGVAFLSFIALTPLQQLLPFYLSNVVQLSAAGTGLRYATATAFIAIVQPFSGWMADKVGSRLVTSAGLLVQGAGLASLALLPEREYPAWLVAQLALVGVGVGLFRSPNHRALFASVPRARVGEAGGYQHLPRQLGENLGETTVITIWTAIVLAAAGVGEIDLEQHDENDELATELPPAAQMVGYRALFALGGAITLMGALVSFLLRTREPEEPS